MTKRNHPEPLSSRFSPRRVLAPLFVVAFAVALWFSQRPDNASRPSAPSSGAGGGAASSSGGTVAAGGGSAPARPSYPKAGPEDGPPSLRAASAPAFDPINFPLAAPLNAPNSNIDGDLDALRQILEAWRSNFPRQGNPVGENHEIAAALTGANPSEITLIPKTHPALNARGELCDRWGTPFRFHQLSGERMEISSAGPDRKFGTGDDARWSPP